MLTRRGLFWFAAGAAAAPVAGLLPTAPTEAKAFDATARINIDDFRKAMLDRMVPRKSAWIGLDFGRRPATVYFDHLEYDVHWTEDRGL